MRSCVSGELIPGPSVVLGRFDGTEGNLPAILDQEPQQAVGVTRQDRSNHRARSGWRTLDGADRDGMLCGSRGWGAVGQVRGPAEGARGDPERFLRPAPSHVRSWRRHAKRRLEI